MRLGREPLRGLPGLRKRFKLSDMIQTLAFQFDPKKKLLILDQTLLPEKKEWIKIEHPREMISAIQKLQVRGANLIGISAGFTLAQYALTNPKEKDLKYWAKMLSEARPTAIHLSKAVNLIIQKKSPEKKLEQAIAFYEEDKKACDQIAERSRPLINKGDGLLTYCNTGALAVGGSGTALGVILQAFHDQKNIHAFVCETRPLNQGSRLTLWELNKAGVPCTLICDNMIAHLISQNKIHKALVGADRISAKGDTANKIGTYNLAVLCRHFQIPFYVTAPSSTIDKSLSEGKDIPIEQRNPKEISPYWAEAGASIENPAFDITPKELITGIITEKEIWKPY